MVNVKATKIRLYNLAGGKGRHIMPVIVYTYLLQISSQVIAAEREVN